MRSFAASVKNYLAAIILMALNALSFAQTALPYYTGFDTPSQQSGWNVFRKGTVSTGSWVFSTANSVSPPNAIVHFNPSGGIAVTDDWLVSPSFDFSGGALIDTIWHYFSGNTIAAGDTIALYLLTGASDPDIASSKTILRNYSASWQGDNVWHADTAISIPAMVGTSYLAIRYRSASSLIDVRFDNLSVSAATTDINGFETDGKLYIYPNPAGDNLYLTENNAIRSIYITDINGRVLKTVEPAEIRNKKIDLSSIGSGNYFLRIETEDKGAVTQPFSVVK